MCRKAANQSRCVICLTGGPGLYDPCEKDPSDVTEQLSSREREAITANAQVRIT